jgi:hypothetical protein
LKALGKRIKRLEDSLAVNETSLPMVLLPKVGEPGMIAISRRGVTDYSESQQLGGIRNA